ncbi:MAG: HNH endonuclease [Muribaculaceae bacterium]|jgi:hypothetical protein
MEVQHEEIWRDIEGYEGLYQVSSHGRVKSMDKPMFYGDSDNVKNHECSIRASRILKGRMKKNGYIQIGLSKDGIQRTFTVHRLVAQAFIPNPTHHPYVNHKDENKINNHADNLEWCTPTYNTRYGSGICRQSMAARNKPNAVKGIRKVYQYTLSGDYITEYPSVNEAARQTGIKQGTISSNCLGVSKSTNGFIFRYDKI